jgi:hypothetical protein
MMRLKKMVCCEVIQFCKTFNSKTIKTQAAKNFQGATWNDSNEHKCSVHIFKFAQILVSVLDVIMQGMAFQEPPHSDGVLVQAITASEGWNKTGT